MNHLKFSGVDVVGKLVREDYGFDVMGAKRPTGDVGGKLPKYIKCGMIFRPEGRQYSDLRKEGLALVEAAFTEQKAFEALK